MVFLSFIKVFENEPELFKISSILLLVSYSKSFISLNNFLFSTFKIIISAFNNNYSKAKFPLNLRRVSASLIFKSISSKIPNVTIKFVKGYIDINKTENIKITMCVFFNFGNY